MEVHMKKRCISAYVENQIGVLAKISGLMQYQETRRAIQF